MSYVIVVSESLRLPYKRKDAGSSSAGNTFSMYLFDICSFFVIIACLDFFMINKQRSNLGVGKKGFI